jgi:predicted RNA binding protein YcfA (HicA-like mRNA interferase family)
MKLPRDASGRDLAKNLIHRWGYRRVHQVGGHIILQTEEPAHHRISVPDHSPLRIGILNGILRAVAQAKRVTRDEIADSLD